MPDASQTVSKGILRSRDFTLLVAAVPELCLHTLTAKDLELARDHALPSNLYDHAAVQVWRKAIAETFNGCLFYALEVGSGDFKTPKRGYIHAHVLAASYDGLGERFRATEKCKPVYDIEGILRYLVKPSEAYSLEAVLEWQIARLRSKGNEAPRVRGWLTSKKRQLWNANALRPLNCSEV